MIEFHKSVTYKPSPPNVVNRVDFKLEVTPDTFVIPKKGLEVTIKNVSAQKQFVYAHMCSLRYTIEDGIQKEWDYPHYMNGKELQPGESMTVLFWDVGYDKHRGYYTCTHEQEEGDIIVWHTTIKMYGCSKNGRYDVRREEDAKTFLKRFDSGEYGFREYKVANDSRSYQRLKETYKRVNAYAKEYKHPYDEMEFYELVADFQKYKKKREKEEGRGGGGSGGETVNLRRQMGLNPDKIEIKSKGTLDIEIGNNSSDQGVARLDAIPDSLPDY
ncbi:unnamed protein product [Caenorhabditis sp. 36 PRJEB53466]|nr:unnamed protein product [Caenorhabditis sp. 36 PRJEB53466]